MPKKPTYGELQRRVAELEAQQQEHAYEIPAREAAESLRESREKLAAAFASMTEAIFIADADGRLTDFNDEFIRYHRFKNRAACSKMIAECPIYLEAYFQDGTPAPVEMWAMPRALRGETQSNVEYMLRRKDTGETWWGSYNFGPIKHEDGRITGAIVAAREITDQKRAEAAQRESEERLQLAQQAARVGTFEWNLQTDRDVWTPELEAIHGLQPGEFAKTGIAWQQLVHPEDRMNTMQLSQQSLQTGELTTGEWRVVWPDGSVHWLAGRWQVFKDASGRPLRMIGVNMDITERKQAEEALRRSEYRFRELADAMPQLVWTANDEGTVDYYSAQAALYKGGGRTADGLWTWTPIIHPDDLEATLAAWRSAVAGSDNYQFAHRLHMADDSYRWHLSRAYRVRTLNGTARWYGTATDIHDLKQAEEALAVAHSHVQSIINNTTSLIYGFDLEERIVMANNAVAELFNSTPEQMIGKRRHEFMPKADAYWHEANDRQVIESGRPLEFEEHSQLEGRSIIWLTTKFPLRDAQGRIYAVGGISTDVSASKEAEEHLKRNQKTFSELVERAPFGIYIVDSKFCIAHMNAGSQNGAFRNVRPLIGRDFSEAMRILWPESVAAEIVGHFRHTLETGEPYYSPRFSNPRNDIGIIESYEWELHQMMLPDGQYGVICYYFDSTGLRNAELALQEANATLENKVEERTLELTQRAAQLRALTGELALAEQRERSRLANILHDHLQQMLVAAKFRLTILGRSRDDVVTQAAKEVEELIDESILASRSLTAELSPPILHEAGLNEGLQWLARRMADTQGLFVDLELSESSPLPEDLKILLFQSVRELLFNVVKHAHTRSAVVNLRRLAGSLQVTVSDQGSGFDPAAMQLAGEGGRGFGLLGIQERLKYLGGTLEIESNPDQGSRFVLSVPVTTPAANESTLQGLRVMPEAHLVATSKYSDPGRKIRVMLADDHAIFRQGIATLLAVESGIEVIGEAADGQEAVDLAAKLQPDVILMDLSMPKLNGVEATRIIHNDWPEILIIGLSMFEEEERSRAIRDAGAVDYVTKSGPSEDLIKVIRTCIGASNKGLSAKT
jgi:PAS domain S-box-containing protein